MCERDQEALAARVAAPLRAETRGQLGDARTRRLRRGQRAVVLVDARVLLVRQGQEPEDLVEDCVVHAHRLVEREPERVEQRVERVPPLGRHRERRAGKRMTSRIASLPVSTIVSRSIPTPQPPVGGIP